MIRSMKKNCASDVWKKTNRLKLFHRNDREHERGKEGIYNKDTKRSQFNILLFLIVSIALTLLVLHARAIARNEADRLFVIHLLQYQKPDVVHFSVPLRMF